jgi:plastocyanin
MPSLALSQTVQTPKEAIEFGLQDGTPVKLRLSRNMSSADAKTGETVDFEVLEDIKSGDVIIIPRGAVALGTVTNAKPKGRMGKGGKLDINVDSVQAVSGEKLALRAVKENKGGSHTGAMTGAIVASSILFFPAAPFFLFMKGKDIKIPKGTEVTAYVNGDAALNRAKFVPGDSSALAAENNAAAAISDSASVALKSNPEGAEITIDGKFMGSTPSSLNLKPGDYTISITKAGYTPWQRTVTLNAKGNITLDAALEKNP